MKKIIIALFIFSIVFLVGCEQKQSDVPVACTMEAKTCPDGSSVGRVGPDCEFEPCPGESAEFCVKKDTNEKLSLTEAKQIALNSDCVNEGTLKDTYMCNEYTGTWWLDLDVEKQGCMPSCVINVATKEAKINWRCTGLIMPEETTTEQQSKETAESFAETSSTYQFDGSGLELTSSQALDCENCYEFSFGFTSSAAGYGDRTGMMLAQVITPHKAIITVKEGNVDSAVLDGKWDMVRQEMIEE